MLRLHRRVLHLPFAIGLIILTLPARAALAQALVEQRGGQSHQPPNEPPSGRIIGTVLDSSGAIVRGARIALTRNAQSSDKQTLSGDNGEFSFSELDRGPFQLTFASPGFAPQTFSGTLQWGEAVIVPQITLAIAPAMIEVRVSPPLNEVAEEQIREQEKQRVLGVIPNFYVSYIPNAAPLTAKQKFKLAWKTTVDPVNFGLIGAVAGVEQANDSFSGYGQGAQGFAKRYGAAYADVEVGTFIGGVVLPSVLKQDPRYFYKGTGSKRSRILYAIGNSFFCKGDNGRWQVNYSNIVGGLAGGAISNLYYPGKDRNGAGPAFETGAIGIGVGAAANVIEELIGRGLTSNVPARSPSEP
jgi:hypothetical protein